MSQTKVWFITGASRGLGFEIVKAALASGDKVVATVRKDPEQFCAAVFIIASALLPASWVGLD